MNIRRFLSLGFVSVASIFWASCDSESNPQTPDNSQDPESSADAAKSSSSAEPESSAAEPESSAEAVSSSSEESVPPPSSSDIAQSSSSSVERLKLARDTSVTCSSYVFMQQQCSQSQSSEPSYSCMELQEFLKKDTTVSEKILNKWEEMLESCDAIRVMEAQPVYGIIYPVCPYVASTYLKCSDGKTYQLYANDDGIAYVTKKEYDETHSSSSVAESSSSSAPTDLVTNCPHDGFALFADILADVQKEMYELIVSGDIYAMLEGETWFTDKSKEYVESLLDHDKKALKGNFAPFELSGFDFDPLSFVCSESDNWFDGYIAKTKTCADGTTVETDKYKETYKAIFNESFDIVFENAKNAVVE